MDLCKICQQFDIRALLLASASPDNAVTEDYHRPLPYFYAHYGTILELKSSSAHGCKLCELFWGTWMAELMKAKQSENTDTWLSSTFQGELYIGASGWTTSRQGLPYVTLSQRTPLGQARTLCSFDAFAERGMDSSARFTSLAVQLMKCRGRAV